MVFYISLPSAFMKCYGCTFPRGVFIWRFAFHTKGETFHFLIHRMRVLHSTMDSHSSNNALEETAYHANHFVPGIAAIAVVVFPHSSTTHAKNTKLIP